jgi:hypothetical protein
MFDTDQAPIYSVETKRARKRGKVKRLNRGKKERTKERRQNGFFDGMDNIKLKWDSERG